MEKEINNLLMNDKNTSSILFLGSQMETGGAQRILLEQAQWFFEKGNEVTVAFLYDKEGVQERWREQNPFPIINLKARSNKGSKPGNILRFIAGLVRTYRLMQSKRFDCVETFTHHPNMIGLPIAWLAGIPVRVASHHGMFHGFGTTLQWIHSLIVNSNAASVVVAVSENVRNHAIHEGINPKKIIVIPNGVRIPVVNIPESRRKIRAELNIEANDPVLLTVGRMQVEKGHDLLLQAVPEILKQFPQAKILFAGNGLLLNQLEQQVLNLGIMGKVFFLGFRDDIPELMAASDLLVMPSRTEGMPNALLEAMAIGLPVVAFHVGGIGEAAVHGVTGLLVTPLEVKCLAEAVSTLLADDQSRKKMGKATIVIVKNDFTIDIMCQRYAAYLVK